MLQKDFEHYKKNLIPLCSQEKLKNIFPGEWESIYTGGGIEFDSIKPFEPGDDLKDIDFHTLVQSGEEEIIHRKAGRQMKIFICADFSGSMQRFEKMFFPSKPKIREMVIGLLLFSTWKIYSPVGLFSFNGEINQFFPARYGQSYCEKILGWIINNDKGEYNNNHSVIDIQKTLTFLQREVSPQSMVFFVSDFEDHIFEGDFTTLLRPAVEKFDLIPVIIGDPLLKKDCLKNPVRIAVRDNEGDKRVEEIFLTPQKLKRMQEISHKHLLHLRKNFRQLGIDPVIVDTHSMNKCYKIFTDFFRIRQFTKRY
jgi:uncharacterized protein (DUF58 family)